jgi:hypothetical protein
MQHSSIARRAHLRQQFRPRIHSLRTSATCASVLFLVLACAPPRATPGADAGAPTRTPLTARDTMAAPGDTMLVGLNHVKPDQRQAYERALEAFWRGGIALGARDSMVLKAFRYTRVLYPTRPEKDDTYTYVFLADPLIKRAPYDITVLLHRMYPATRADSIDRVMNAALAREQEVVIVTQTPLNR